MKGLSVFDVKGKTTGKISLDQSYFNGRIDKHLLHRVVLMYLCNRRSGCASTKTRPHVRGGGKKPWRQKGTGRARIGSIRSPLWRGGGVVFGPHPRKYRDNLPKNIKELALKHSLNDKIKDNKFLVVDAISLSTAKTKEFLAFLSALKVKESSLVVIERHNSDIIRASRNIPQVTVKSFNNFNAHDVLKHKTVILTKQALENLVKLTKK